MYYTGFADEAASDLAGQIRATKELGWQNIESRNIDGTNIHELDDAAFDKVVETLDGSGVMINCFGSAVANWACQITSPMEDTTTVLDRTIPRMQRLGSKLIRIMSYAVLKENTPDDQMEEERFKRLREIVKRFQDAGITPVHENCMNYGGMGWQYTLRMIENVPGLRLVFDTGNPVFTPEYITGNHDKKQSAWEFYTHVKDHIEYVHIKDGVWDADAGKTTFTYPGEGEGDVVRIVSDLLANGYDGGFSMEPHLAVVHHEENQMAEEEQKYNSYIEYGKRFMKIVDACKANA